VIHVNIVTSDRGWILERLANEITSRLPYVSLGQAVDRSADINYYVTYSTWKAPSGGLDVAFFAHHEPVSGASEHFFTVARHVDHCVTMSAPYEALLRENGISAVTTISPGVDQQRFVPKVKIGVVGRTYHTGRKGEHLVATVMDIPGIEWHFTGDGWPLPGKHLSDDELPGFYRDMDYILVSSLYEGGPMCVLEALASGTPVIGPDVGWIPELPRIPFQLGDPVDLRRVLLDLVARKMDLRASVSDRTWDAWADAHDRLFTRLAGTSASRPTATGTAGPSLRVGLMLHGNEGNSPGGPTVRVPRLAQELGARGSDAVLGYARQLDVAGRDIVHCFNVWGPDSAVGAIRHAKSLDVPVVFSPIFLDLSARRLWDTEIPPLFDGVSDPGEIDAALARLARRHAERVRRTGGPPEIQAGFYGTVREMLARADHVIFLSEFERSRLEEIGATTEHGTLVRNPVDTELWEAGDPSLFRDAYGVSDYVLCVGRLESRKNQLMLLHALRGTGLPIVLIGHRPQPSYYQRLLALAGPNVRLIERLDPNSPMLASAVAGARVFVLPSWAEGAPLSALEAGSAGVSLVLSDASGEREYFGDRALYCDPGDPASIRDAVLTAYGADRPASIAAEQRAYVKGTFGWARHVEQTQRVYAETLARHRSRRSAEPVAKPATEAPPRPTVILDITTSAGRKGRWTGISRVEMALAQALQQLDIDVRFVGWNGTDFVPVPSGLLTPELLSSYLADTRDVAAASYPANSVLVVAGSAWMQSAVYPNAVVVFARNQRLSLCSIIYDIIPYKFPHWFEPKYAPVFLKNLATLLEFSDIVISDSESTRRDILEFAHRLPPRQFDIRTMRCGDEIRLFPGTDHRRLAPEGIAALAHNAGYVLSVGALHTRKNQGLLCDLWSALGTSLGSRCPKLVIVGGVAWNGQDVARRIKEDRSLVNLVVMLDDVGDDDLDVLYRNCLLTVYPSLYEGWGLPVAESLRYGKICLASASSSIPEIAPQLTDLIDPRDFPTWLAKLKFYLGSSEARYAREAIISTGYRSTSWVETASELVDHLTTRRVSAAQPYPIGTILDLSKFVTMAQFGAGGWLPPERWGVWSGAETAHIRISLATHPRGRLVMVARVQSLASKSVPHICDVLCNGQIIATWHLTQAGMHPRTALIPVADATGPDPLTITFRSRVRRRPSDLQALSTDTRLLGIGLARLVLAEAEIGELVQAYLEPSDIANDVAEPGRLYNFVDDAKARRFLVGNWKLVSPSWGLQEEHDKLKIGFSVVEHPTEDLLIELEVRPVATDTHPITISVILADGSVILSGRFSSDEVLIIPVTIPAELRQVVQPTLLQIIGRAAGSPVDLKVGANATPFKLGLLSMKITSQSTCDVVPSYRTGDVITFDTADKESLHAAPGRSYLQTGWNPPESGAAWSRAKVGLLRFELEEAELGSRLLILRIEVLERNSSLGVTFNGVPLETLGTPDEGGTRRVYWIPDRHLRPGGTNTIALESEETVNLYETGTMLEDRRLGVRLWSLAMIAPFQLGAGQAIAFETDQACHAAVSGWHPREVGGRWTKETASIAVLLTGRRDEAIRMVLAGWSHDATPSTPLIAEVDADGCHLTSYMIDDNAVHDIVFDIPPRSAPDDGLVMITIRLNRASSPAQTHSSGSDPRALGLFIQQLRRANAPDSTSEESTTFRQFAATDDSGPAQTAHSAPTAVRVRA